MVKIRYYLFSNVKSELNYSSKEKTEIELATLVQECGFFNEEKEEGLSVNDDEIPINEVYVLIINDIVNITSLVFARNGDEGEVNESKSEKTSNELEEEELYSAAISNILALANM